MRKITLGTQYEQRMKGRTPALDAGCYNLFRCQIDEFPIRIRGRLSGMQIGCILFSFGNLDRVSKLSIRSRIRSVEPDVRCWMGIDCINLHQLGVVANQGPELNEVSFHLTGRRVKLPATVLAICFKLSRLV